MKRSLWRKIGIYLAGVVLGVLILRVVPRKERGEDLHPWHAQTAPEGTYPLEVTDDYGRTIRVERQPRWIVSLAPGTTEMLAAMEMEDHLIAVSEIDAHPFAQQLRDNGMNVGRIDSPDMERIYSLGADVVIGSRLTPRNVYDRIQRSPAPLALALDPESLDDLLQNDFPTLGRLLGVPTRALRAVVPLRERRAAVHAQLAAVADQPPRTAVILLGLEDNLTPGWSPGDNTWPDSLIREAHGENIAASLGPSWGQISLEGLLAADPDVILIVDGESAATAARLRKAIDSLPEHPVWQHLRAVQEERVVIIDAAVMTVPGPEMVTALELIAESLWPGVFGSPAAAR